MKVLRILVAEDDVMVKRLLLRLLASTGHQIITAANGKEAFEKWRDEQPDMILMDILMPIWDGIKATTEIRKAETGQSRTPIVAMTGFTSPAEHKQFYQAQMDAVILKPFSTESLRSGIERVWAQHGPRDERQTVVFDEAGALDNVQGDAMILRTSLEDYAQTYERIATEIERAVTSHDWTTVRWKIHNLLGHPLTLSADGFTPVLEQLHIAVKEGNAEAAEQALPGVIEAIQALAQQVKAILSRSS